MKATFNVSLCYLQDGIRHSLFIVDVVECIVPSPGTVIITDLYLQEFRFDNLIDLDCIFPLNLSKVVKVHGKKEKG